MQADANEKNVNTVTLDPCEIMAKLLMRPCTEELSPHEWEIVDSYLCRKTPAKLGERLKIAIERIDDTELGHALLERIDQFKAAQIARQSGHVKTARGSKK